MSEMAYTIIQRTDVRQKPIQHIVSKINDYTGLFSAKKIIKMIIT